MKRSNVTFSRFQMAESSTTARKNCAVLLESACCDFGGYTSAVQPLTLTC
jgi:hypothetical protein